MGSVLCYQKNLLFRVQQVSPLINHNISSHIFLISKPTPIPFHRYFNNYYVKPYCSLVHFFSRKKSNLDFPFISWLVPLCMLLKQLHLWQPSSYFVTYHHPYLPLIYPSKPLKSCGSSVTNFWERSKESTFSPNLGMTSPHFPINVA